jgi:hypothetical protein
MGEQDIMAGVLATRSEVGSHAEFRGTRRTVGFSKSLTAKDRLTSVRSPNGQTDIDKPCLLRSTAVRRGTALQHLISNVLLRQPDSGTTIISFAVMRFFDVTTLVVLAATLSAMPHAANARLAERGALGARAVPPHPPATLVKRAPKECPKKYQTCPQKSQCCLEADECCNGML